MIPVLAIAVESNSILRINQLPKATKSSVIINSGWENQTINGPNIL